MVSMISSMIFGESVIDEPQRKTGSAQPPVPTRRLSFRHGADEHDIRTYMSVLAATLTRQVACGHVAPSPDSTPSISGVGGGLPSTPLLEDVFSESLGDLGRGHMGVVTLRRDLTTGEAVACKSIAKCNLRTPDDVAEVLAEVCSMLRVARSPKAARGSVALREVLEDSHSVHLIQDYCAGGDLFDHIAARGHLPESEAAQMLEQVAQTVRGMHSAGLIHRDLKPENILLTGELFGDEDTADCPEVRVADFGLCAMLRPGQQAKGVSGSPFYMAPEVIRGLRYGAEVDVWSLGVILYTCLSGHLPFWGQGTDKVFLQVLKGQVNLNRGPWPGVSAEAKQLVRQMLHPDRTQRITMEGVLAHPWIRKHSGKAYLAQGC